MPIETVHKCALFAGFTGVSLPALGAGIALWTGGVLSEQSKAQIEGARSSADIARRDTETLRNQNLGLQREVEELHGYKPARKQMKEIKEQIIIDLMPRS